MLNKSYTLILLKSFVFISFFQGAFFMLGIPGSLFKAMISYFSLYLLLEIIFNTKLKNNYSSIFFLVLLFFYTLTVIISGIYNNDTVSETYSYYLYTLPGFLIYIIISNKNFNDNQIIELNKIFMGLFLIQIIVAILKFVFRGTSETLVGTIHYTNGSLNTIFPLIAISMIIGFYYFYNNNKAYIFLALCFMFIAWTGEKRGVYFYLVILLVISHLSFLKINRMISLQKLFLFSTMIIPILLLIIYIGVRIAPTLNPEGVYGGNFYWSYLINYIINYNLQFNESGMAGGRLSGIINVFKSMYFNDSTSSLFIGDGPGTLLGIKDTMSNNVQSKYMLSTLSLGINGWSTSLISLGFFGAIVTTCIYLYISVISYKQSKKENIPYWRAITFGTFLMSIVFFFDFFTYSRTFYHTIPLNIILFYFFGIVIRRKYNQQVTTIYS